MKRVLLVVIGILLIASTIFAGEYMITTTVEQDAVLAEASAFYGFPVNAIIEDYKLRAIADLKPKMEKEKRKAIILKYDSLTPEQKVQVDSVLMPIFMNSTSQVTGTN